MDEYSHPTIKWLSPDNNSVITTHSVRLAVDIPDTNETNRIGSVVFYATYYLGSNDFHRMEEIGRVSGFPYEMTWDCSKIPDQMVQFSYEISDRKGKIISIHTMHPGNTNNSVIVLDRNPRLNDARLSSHRVHSGIIIDGDLSEWAPRDSIVFNNNDNRITVFSAWDKRFLYFSARCQDRSIIGYGDSKAISIFDILEFYIDPDHNHAPLWILPDRHYLIPVSGSPFERVVTSRSVGTPSRIEYSVNSAVRVYGTLNLEGDVDSCYTMELAIPWKHLGIKPGDLHGMGLEVWNNDRDFINGNYLYSGWTTTTNTVGNSSEWGNIEFIETATPRLTSLFPTLFAILGVSSFFMALILIRGQLRRSAPETVLPPNISTTTCEKENIIAAKRYIDEHFAEDLLSREKVARSVGLTPSYFGKLFSRETGMSFTDYLTDYRIKKAKTLLLTTTKNISEIAFEVGFSNLSHFGFVFKKLEKVSPRSFRNKSRKHEKPHFEN